MIEEKLTQRNAAMSRMIRAKTVFSEAEAPTTIARAARTSKETGTASRCEALSTDESKTTPNGVMTMGVVIATGFVVMMVPWIGDLPSSTGSKTGTVPGESGETGQTEAAAIGTQEIVETVASGTESPTAVTTGIGTGTGIKIVLAITTEKRAVNKIGLMAENGSRQAVLPNQIYHQSVPSVRT